MNKENEIIFAHTIDLINKSNDYRIITSTSFLSLSEQSYLTTKLQDYKKEYKNNLDFLFDSLNKDSDRKILFIKPIETSFQELSKYINETISILYCYPKNIKFSEELTHRDFLGALMNLGIKRNKIGDIIVNYTNKYEAIIYIEKNIKEIIINNLDKVKHTNYLVKEINQASIPFETYFEYINIYVSSLRLDNIIKEVFNISRNDAQSLIEKECVFINGKTITSSSYLLRKDDRVSIKSKGKFIFLDETSINKKGRYHTKIKKYS